MRALFKVALLVGGVALVAWSVKPLVLLVSGRKVSGVITSVGGASVKTEMSKGTRSVAKPTGAFRVNTPVTYTFDILPTPLEVLNRLSEAPIATGVRGSDTLYGKTRFADVPLWSVGDELPVLCLKSMPSFNAAYQPNSMRTLGLLRLVGGLGLLLWGFLFRVQKRPPVPGEEAAEADAAAAEE